MDMSKPIRVLVLEDSAIDAEINIRELCHAGFDPQWKRVETEADYLVELDNPPELILADYSMPHFNGLRAATLLRERELYIPFILISGTMGEEVAVEAMKHGVNDYLLKDRIARLGPAVEHALEKQRLRVERQQAEEKLRASELRYRRLFETSNDGIIIVDAQTGAIEDANPALLEMINHPRLDFQGRQLWEIGLFENIVSNEAAFRRLQDEKFIHSEVLPVENENGHSLWLELTSKSYPVNGKQLTQCIVRDITERKQLEIKARKNFEAAEQSRQALYIMLDDKERAEEALRASEEKYRMLADYAEDFVMLKDIQGKCLYLSPSFSRVTGWTMNEIQSTDWCSPVLPDNLLIDYARVENLAGETTNIEHRVRCKDGRSLWVEEHCKLIRDTDGKVKNLLHWSRDITERKNAELHNQKPHLFGMKAVL